MVAETGPLSAHSISSGQRPSLGTPINMIFKSVSFMVTICPGVKVNSAPKFAEMGGSGVEGSKAQAVINSRQMLITNALRS